ncbi:MAG: site-specific integrase [Corallococcus sp.]|nr:site-specific integrase [Corallococcus sp.]MCM1359340.1 site-specific integrase [Corallococcus sp.]MCM1394783.1 site-specific integrase [Corallococcus sp.]
MNEQQMILLSQKLVMLSLAKDNEERKRLTAEIAALNAELTESAESNEKTVFCRPLKFTEQEISKMPKNFRRVFRFQGCVAHIRKRCDWRYNCSYEIRYHRDGYNISASARTIEQAKEKFIEKIIAADNAKTMGFSVPKNFEKFSLYWLENFHKRKVGPGTFRQNNNLYKRYLSEAFGQYTVAAITPLALQTFLDRFDDRQKTKSDLRSLLNQLFTSAVNHGLIRLNPLGMVVRTTYEKQHGKAFSKDEERLLFEKVPDKYRLCYAIALYTGLRPNEFATATVDGQFIKAVNSKRHNNGKVVYKRIPITPKLQPYLTDGAAIKFPAPRTLGKILQSILPGHKLYDSRTTFQTRCTECGIPDNVIGIFMGNSIGKLKEAYTDFSDEYLFAEGQKLRY